MGFYLLDRRNPYGDHFYTSRREPLLAIVVHGTAGAEDLDTLNDLSAENVAAYAAGTDRDVSWHTGSDADSWVNLLPSSYTAWHATDYNSCTHGHEFSKRHMDWRSMPAVWVDKTLRMGALGPDGRGGLRKVALDNGIPLRWATRAELDEQRANFRAGRPWRPVGFITHHEVQPADRTDPGYVREGGRLIDTFPRARFMALLNGEDDMSWDEMLVHDPTKFSAPAKAFLTYTNAAVNEQGAKLDELRRVLVGNGTRPLIQQHVDFIVNTLGAQVAGLNAAVSKLAALVGQQDGADAAEIEAAVAKAIRENTLHVDIDVNGPDNDPTT